MCVCVYIYIYMCVYIYIHVCVCVYIYMCVCDCVYTQTDKFNSYIKLVHSPPNLVSTLQTLKKHI